MNYEWNTRKAIENRRKHGIDFVDAIAAIEDPNRIEFDLRRVLRTDYKIDDYQQTYFVIDRFRDLLDTVLEADLPALYAELEGSAEFTPNQVIEGDRLVA